MNGHCGLDQAGNYIKCDSEYVSVMQSAAITSIYAKLIFRNVQCGSLQCKEGDHNPIIDGMDKLFSRTIISIKGLEYECK